MLVWLNDPNIGVPELVGPTAMVVSSWGEMLYLASSVTNHEISDGLTTRVYRFSISKNPDGTIKYIAYDSFVDINGPLPRVCIDYPRQCNPDLGYTSAITSMVENPETGVLYITGFTAPRFPEDEALDSRLISNQGIFTTPMLAVVWPNDSLVNANEITGSDLALPLSMVWVGVDSPVVESNKAD